MKLQEFKNSIKHNFVQDTQDRMTYQSYDVDEIKSEFEKLNIEIAKYENNWDAYAKRSTNHFRMEEMEEAVSDAIETVKIIDNIIAGRIFDEKITDFPDEDKPYIMYYYLITAGMLCFKANDYHNSLLYYSKANETLKESGDTFHYLGNAYLFLNELQIASLCWDKSLKLGTTFSEECMQKLKIINNILNLNKESDYIFIDDRDGKKYKTIEIGEQMWFADNLNYEISGSRAFDLNTTLRKNYGRYYNHSQAIEACPKGWRIPTVEDFKELIQNLGGYEEAGKKLLEGGESGFESILLGRNNMAESKNENSVDKSTVDLKNSINSSINLKDKCSNYWALEKHESHQPFYFFINNAKITEIKQMKRIFPENYYLNLLLPRMIPEVSIENVNPLVGLNVRCIKE